MFGTIAWLLCTLLVWGLQAPPPPPPAPPPLRISGAIPLTGDATIAGLVRRLDTGEPLTGVPVLLTGLQDSSGGLSQLQAFSDAAGRFVFERLPASTYTLHISPDNLFATQAGGNSTAVTRASITLSGGQRISNLVFNLLPGGVIHGVIRDDDGHPTANISVWALRVTYRDGRKVLENAKSVPSDDLGEFRLYSMPPGDYYVRAAGTLNGKAVVGFFPGGSSIETATVVRVRAGEESVADLRIPPLQFVRISGRVINSIPELAADPESFVLMPRNTNLDDGTAATILPNLAVDKSSGRFEIRALAGSYDLMPAAGIRPGAPVDTGNPHFYTGRVPIEVHDQDVENVTVTVSRGADLNVQISGAAALFRLGLRPLDKFPTPLTANNLAARAVSADGTIQFHAVPEGTYALVIPAPTPGVYISDIRQGERDVYDSGAITVGRDTADPVKVVLSSDGGRLSGTVNGASRVSLIPEGTRRDNLLLYQRAAVVDGRFVVTDIPPGSYRIYAWEELPAGTDENAEFMAAYESRGRVVSVKAGASETDIALQLIRR